MADDRLITLVAPPTGSLTSVLAAFNATARMVGWADVIGERVAAAIRRRAPVGKGDKRGRLRDATRYSRRTAIGGVRLEFHARGVPYVPYVIRGTRPHDIVPKAALRLHWTTPTGVSVFARRVHHPGTKANPYPELAARDMRPELAATLKAAFERHTP